MKERYVVVIEKFDKYNNMLDSNNEVQFESENVKDCIDYINEASPNTSFNERFSKVHEYAFMIYRDIWNEEYKDWFPDVAVHAFWFDQNGKFLR